VQLKDEGKKLGGEESYLLSLVFSLLGGFSPNLFPYESYLGGSPHFRSP
jgi:hypothetical protein